MKLPAFQFYPGDWRKDPNLCRCSHAAKGVWIDMICLMHETEERGVLSTNGIPWTEDDIVLAVGGDSSVTRAAIQELTLKGVVNRGVDGAFLCRRIVRDEKKRIICKEAGKLGGNPNLVPTLKGGVKGGAKGGVNPSANPKPTPSSSSSSSSSNSNPDGLVVGSPSLPPCPHLRLLELFGHHLPDLPQPKPELWQGKNADAMRARWKWVLTAKTKAGKRYAVTEAEAVDWFSRFFAYVSRSDFLTGRSGKWTNCDLGWLMKADNFAKVVQGNYENREIA